jgi:hypothetical protein
MVQMLTLLMLQPPCEAMEVQDEIQKEKVVLLQKREDRGDEVGREGASAEEADADQCEADGVTGQGQHENLRCVSAWGNGCAGRATGRQTTVVQSDARNVPVASSLDPAEKQRSSGGPISNP